MVKAAFPLRDDHQLLLVRFNADDLTFHEEEEDDTRQGEQGGGMGLVMKKRSRRSEKSFQAEKNNNKKPELRVIPTTPEITPLAEQGLGSFDELVDMLEVMPKLGETNAEAYMQKIVPIHFSEIMSTVPEAGMPVSNVVDPVAEAVGLAQDKVLSFDALEEVTREAGILPIMETGMRNGVPLDIDALSIDQNSPTQSADGLMLDHDTPSDKALSFMPTDRIENHNTQHMISPVGDVVLSPLENLEEDMIVVGPVAVMLNDLDSAVLSGVPVLAPESMIVLEDVVENVITDMPVISVEQAISSDIKTPVAQIPPESEIPQDGKQIEHSGHKQFEQFLDQVEKQEHREAFVPVMENPDFKKEQVVASEVSNNLSGIETIIPVKNETIEPSMVSGLAVLETSDSSQTVKTIHESLAEKGMILDSPSSTAILPPVLENRSIENTGAVVNKTVPADISKSTESKNTDTKEPIKEINVAPDVRAGDERSFVKPDLQKKAETSGQEIEIGIAGDAVAQGAAIPDTSEKEAPKSQNDNLVGIVDKRDPVVIKPEVREAVSVPLQEKEAASVDISKSIEPKNTDTREPIKEIKVEADTRAADERLSVKPDLQMKAETPGQEIEIGIAGEAAAKGPTIPDTSEKEAPKPQNDKFMGIVDKSDPAVVKPEVREAVSVPLQKKETASVDVSENTAPKSIDTKEPIKEINVAPDVRAGDERLSVKPDLQKKTENAVQGIAKKPPVFKVDTSKQPVIAVFNVNKKGVCNCGQEGCSHKKADLSAAEDAGVHGRAVVSSVSVAQEKVASPVAVVEPPAVPAKPSATLDKKPIIFQNIAKKAPTFKVDTGKPAVATIFNSNQKSVCDCGQAGCSHQAEKKVVTPEKANPLQGFKMATKQICNCGNGNCSCDTKIAASDGPSNAVDAPEKSAGIAMPQGIRIPVVNLAANKGPKVLGLG